MLLSLCFIDADAQTRKKRRPRRAKKPAAVKPVITNPEIAPPGSEQSPDSATEKVISTADQDATETESANENPQPKKTGKAKSSTAPEMQQTINQLSNQVDRLNDKLSQIQQNDRTLINMERLTRAEQRAENLRTQQVDVESKLADLQSKLEQIEYQLRPENIERAAGYGTLHPEEARDTRRRQLEGERARVQAQIRILETSRTRLETSVTTADAEVDTLRQKIEQQAQQDTSSGTIPEPNPIKPPPPE
jgi:predicted  nucleic acid-binding Zn-ribbon protein